MNGRISKKLRKYMRSRGQEGNRLLLNFLKKTYHELGRENPSLFKRMYLEVDK